MRSNTPRPSSRSKRSTTNLSNLRLAPLSSKFTAGAPDRHDATSPYNEPADATFARHHPSYLQGRSAPTTPGILSRSSSRRHLGGGLSRRGSLHENDPDAIRYHYAAVNRKDAGGLRADVGSGRIPKAKSEAALLAQQQRLSGHGVPLQKKRYHERSQTGTHTPRVAGRSPAAAEDDWFTHARAATIALVQESKGQSWLSSRDSSTALHQPDTDDDADDNYEELAAMSVSQFRHHSTDDELGTMGTRKSNWGSRYGSRSASRRTSRRGSFAGPRTPSAGLSHLDVSAGYFDDELAMPVEPDFVTAEDVDEGDESALSRLTGDRSFGLGGIVDRLMGFHLFKVEEREEVTEDESEGGAQTEGGAKERLAVKNRHRREEKEKLTAPRPAPGRDEAALGNAGWQDAAWLLGVASKAMF